MAVSADDNLGYFCSRFEPGRPDDTLVDCPGCGKWTNPDATCEGHVDLDNDPDPYYADPVKWGYVHRMGSQALIWLANDTTDQDIAWACEAELDRRGD
jgi:hypothetical protein